AHCISSWGHDFRPAEPRFYFLSFTQAQLSQTFLSRNHLPGVPILALTAAAKDVMDSLCLQHPLVLRSSFNHYPLRHSSGYKDLLEDVYSDLSNQFKSSGNVWIVYCLERTACDDLSAHLVKTVSLMHAVVHFFIFFIAYHAGLNSKQRTSVFRQLAFFKVQVVVTTVALAGRIRNLLRSLLYYGMDDRRKMEFILSKPQKKQVNSPNSTVAHPKSISRLQSVIAKNLVVDGKILENFEEKYEFTRFRYSVPTSLCNKSSCLQEPKCSYKSLEGRLTLSAHQRTGFSRVLSQYFFPHFVITWLLGHYTEFWNRDEASASRRKIYHSQCSHQNQLNEKLAILQRAEEKYYQAETLQNRAAGKQRLLNTLKQTEQ
ncbi:hypothetical protein MKW92_021826, partial [Papaver armeniacum]